MANVRFVCNSTVHAASCKQPAAQRIELTPWDLHLLLVGPIQKGLLFRKPNLQPKTENDEESLIHHLKTSLSRTLDFFPSLSGRLATVDHDDAISFHVDCNNEGALFVHAVADGVSISDIVEPIFVPRIVHSFFPLNGVLNYEGTSKPLLGVQVTELVDGYFIACTMNHTLCDGTSFWHFFNTWSAISRGSLDYASKPPFSKRWFLEGTHCPILIPRLQLKQIDDDEFILPPLQERVFHFTKENIARLKAKANAEVGNDKISSLQALLSHLWLSIIQNRRLDPDKDTKLVLLVGARSRLQSLPEQYFGNAVQSGTVTMKAKKLLEQGLGNTAREVNRMVVEYTEEKYKDFLKSWANNPKLLTMGGVTRNALITSSSPRFNVYGNDFGWGRPIAVRSGPGNKYDGKITLFCGADEGSIDIEACLSPEVVQAIADDQDFIEAVTI